MGDSPQARILVADDDAHTRNLLAEVCEALGHETLIAEDGERALATALESTPDLMLLDVMMPKLDGFEVLRRIRAAPSVRDTSVIVLTAIGDIDGKLRGIELGADDYVTKPFRIVDLQRRIEQVLDRRCYRSELRSAQRKATESFGQAGAFPELKAGLERAIAEGREQGRPLAALFVSVDDYPMAFEGLGPKASGELLGEIAARLQRALREPDSMFRIDVETFVLLMPDTTCDAANRVAERLIKTVREPPSLASGLEELTVSIGIAGFPTYGVDKPEDLIRAANRALVEARRHGAGSVSVA